MLHNVAVKKKRKKEKRTKRRKGKKKNETVQHNVAVSCSSPRLEPASSVQTLMLLTIHYGLSKEIS